MVHFIKPYIRSYQKSTINKFDSITVFLHSFYSVDSELIYKYRCDQAGNTLSTHCPIGNQLTIVPWVTISSADNITIVYINIKQSRRLQSTNTDKNQSWVNPYKSYNSGQIQTNQQPLGTNPRIGEHDNFYSLK